MSHRIQLRRDKAAFWAQENPVLAQGELAWVSDTGELKIGDGTTPFNELPNILGGVAGTPPNIQETIPVFHDPTDTDQPGWFAGLEPGNFFRIEEYSDDTEDEYLGESLNQFVGLNEQDEPIYNQLIYVPVQEGGEGIPSGGERGMVLIKQSEDDGDADWGFLQGNKSEELGEITGFSGTTYHVAPADNEWTGITSDGNLYVAIASSGTGDRVMTSPDGINWTLQDSPADNDWKAICFGVGIFVAVASSGTGNRVMTSPDGINWTLQNSAADNEWVSVCYGNGLFVAVAFSGSNSRVMTSSDGINWTGRTLPELHNLRSVCFGNGLFVAVGDPLNGDSILTSPDGINWTIQDSPDFGIMSVVWTGNEFVATAFGSTFANALIVSVDGANWNVYSRGDWSGNNRVYFGNGVLVSIADGNPGPPSTQRVRLILDTYDSDGSGDFIVDQTVPFSAACFGPAGLVAVSAQKYAVPPSSVLSDILVAEFAYSSPMIDLSLVAGNFYGQISPFTGGLHLDVNKLVLGGKARIIHSDSAEPEFFGASTDKVTGSYVPDETNFIWVICTDNNPSNRRIEVIISGSAEEAPSSGGVTAEDLQNLQMLIPSAVAVLFPALATELTHSGNPGFESSGTFGTVPGAKFAFGQSIDLELDYQLKPNDSLPVVRLGFCGVDIKLPSGSLPGVDDVLYIKAHLNLLVIPVGGSSYMIISSVKASSYETYEGGALVDDLIHFPGDFLGNDTYMTAPISGDQTFQFKFEADAGVKATLMRAIGITTPVLG